MRYRGVAGLPTTASELRCRIGHLEHVVERATDDEDLRLQ